MSLDLATTHYPADGRSHTPLLMAHGLLGQGRNFTTLAKTLAAEGRDVFVVDMRNHGESPWSDVMSYDAMADDLARVIETRIGRPTIVLGHSMGGKAVIRLCEKDAPGVEAAIIADIAPVAYTHSHIAQIEAMQSVDLASISNRRDADTALASHVGDPQMRAFLIQNMVIQDRVARWKPNLEILARNMDALVGWRENDTPSTEFTGPTLAIRGAKSDYVTEAGLQAMRRTFPKLSVNTLEGAGHWLHAEKPTSFLDAVRHWLEAQVS